MTEHPGYPTTVRPGDRVGAYRILEEIGRGAMGAVFRARDERLDRDVALKFLLPSDPGDGESRERFLREARAAAALDDPHIATIHEIGEAPGGQSYIAMAYYGPRTLRHRIAEGPLPEREAVAIALQVARGLGVAHQKGIVHRDIKPANLLLTDSGQVRIADFGIAKLMHQDLTQTGRALGTAGYMSPEQIRGDPLDHRSDLWSLGIVMYEMLAGRPPFTGGSYWAIADAILHREPAPLGESPPGVSRAGAAIVEQLLRKEAADRFGDAAEVIAALQRADAEPARGRAPLLPDNLPEDPTSFVGRELAIEAVIELLGRARLVTLTGPGGTGKSRLAIQVARRLRPELEGGAAFVPLASLGDPGLAASGIVRALGMEEAGVISARDRLLAHLREARGLLVLDNLEHVLGAVPLLADLVRYCPGLRLLVTSRATLRLQGEREYPVPAMRLPPAGASPAEIAESEAGRLFTERAQAIQPGFHVTSENAPAVATICARLDGLPLAIELAAARLAVLTPGEIADRIRHRLDLLTAGPRDAPARHRALRETIAWSYDLLDGEHRSLFRQLGVFAGGHSLEAAEAVRRACQPSPLAVLDGLQSLLENSLVQRAAAPSAASRFTMLETIREFALERLAAENEHEPANRAHRDYFLALAEAGAVELTGPGQPVWLDRIEREHDNIRAALDWTLANDADSDAGVRFGAALWRFWLVRGHLVEGAARLEAILERSAGDAREARASALAGAGTLAHNRGQYMAARRFYEQCEQLHREAGDEVGLAEALNNLAWVAWRLADYADAFRLAQEGLARNTARRNRRGIAIALNNLGWVHQARGDYAEAQARFEEALDLHRRAGDGRGVAFALSNLGWTLASAGEAGAAASRLEDALVRFEQIGDRQLTAFTRARLGAVLHERGSSERAFRLIRDDALPVFRSLGDLWGVAFALDRLGVMKLDQGDVESAAPLFEESLQLRRATDDARGVAESLARLAATALRRGRAAEAADLYRQSLSLRERMGDRVGIAECRDALEAITE